MHKNQQQLHLNHQYIDELNKKTAALEGKEPTVIQQIIEAPKGPEPMIDLDQPALDEEPRESQHDEQEKEEDESPKSPTTNKVETESDHYMEMYVEG